VAEVLRNVNVVELGHWVAMPDACAILGDWGADVIKIEAAGSGDALRGVMSYEGLSTTERGINCLFEHQNRNKRSFALNLKHEKAKEILRRLIERADVFATNLRTEAVSRAGLDHDTLTKLYPRLIYAIVNGYGFTGKDKNKPGYDYSAFWARSGCMAKFAEQGGPPQPQRAGVGDNVAGMLIAGAVCAALFHRESSGKGQTLFFNLYHTAIWALSHDIELALFRGIEAPNTKRDSVVNPLWNVYQTKDGRWLQLVMVQSDRYWPIFCKVMGLEHLQDDNRFSDASSRQNNSKVLIPILDSAFRTKTCTEWERLYDENDLVCGRVQSVTEVVNDPQAWENQFFCEIEHPICGRMKYITSPVRFGSAAPDIRLVAPQIGQHTEEVLLELGYEWDDIATFRNDGVIG